LNILITNDDGIHAPGIFAIKQALEMIADVLVVAPDTERSAVGHAITLSDPLRVSEIHKENSFFGYAVNGTPADCVKLGLRCLSEKSIDVVVSGINMGPRISGFTHII
jgi:5'-nucleotidase